MEFANLSLAYSAGLLAVLAPCALPMLPSFVAYYMNAEGKEGNLFSAITFGLITVLGFLSVFMVIGVLPSFAINMISSKIDLLVPFIGVILIILGLGHMFTDFFYKIPTLSLASPEGTGYKSFYLYGLGYGAASMACSFPVFVHYTAKRCPDLQQGAHLQEAHAVDAIHEEDQFGHPDSGWLVHGTELLSLT